MALDEALLDLCAAGPERFAPVLRFYAFSPACLSLGRFQRIADIDPEACARLAIDIVRRPSGGRAVLHDRCLTYALIAPWEAAPFAGGVRASANRIGAALAAGLQRLGVNASPAGLQPRRRRPADCFAAPGEGETVHDGRKLVGSAQVRRGGAALQHGTIRLRSDMGTATPLLRDSDRADQLGSRPTALDALAGRYVTFTEAAQGVAAGFAQTFGITFTGSNPTLDELLRAAILEADRSRLDTPPSSPPAQSFTPAAPA